MMPGMTGTDRVMTIAKAATASLSKQNWPSARRPVI
jgi:hypothetical protein